MVNGAFNPKSFTTESLLQPNAHVHTLMVEADMREANQLIWSKRSFSVFIEDTFKLSEILLNQLSPEWLREKMNLGGVRSRPLTPPCGCLQEVDSTGR